MLEPGQQTAMFPATHAVGRSCRVEAELSDSGTKDSFLPDLRIEMSENNMMSWVGHLSYRSSSSYNCLNTFAGFFCCLLFLFFLNYGNISRQENDTSFYYLANQNFL